MHGEHEQHHNTQNSTQQTAPDDAETARPQGTLCFDSKRIVVQGRALELMLWIARHQGNLNAVASQCGQLWMTWKGHSGDSISGNIQTPL